MSDKIKRSSLSKNPLLSALGHALMTVLIGEATFRLALWLAPEPYENANVILAALAYFAPVLAYWFREHTQMEYKVLSGKVPPMSTPMTFAPWKWEFSNVLDWAFPILAMIGRVALELYL